MFLDCNSAISSFGISFSSVASTHSPLDSPEGFFLALIDGGKTLNNCVNNIVYGDFLTQVQLRLPQKVLKEIDRWVAEGRFKSRSDAIRTIISFYEEREKTREFFRMLVKRSEEAKKHPEALIPLEEL